MAEYHRHLSYHQLEALLIGQLDLAKNPELKSHLDGCAECSGYLEKAPNTSAFFKMKYPTFSALKESRVDSGSVPNQGLITSLFSTSLFKPVFTILFLLVVGSSYFYWNAHQGSDLSYKGGSPVFRLQINGREAVSVKDTIPVASGDTLLLTLTSSESQYYYIAYRDDQAEPVLYFPLAEEKIKPLGTPQGEPLPNFIVLSTGWTIEELFCITSKTPISRDKALKFLKEDKKPEEVHMSRFILRNSKP